jgi:hypothetical protein
VLGEQAPLISSTKSMTGHLIGAARRRGDRVHQDDPRRVFAAHDQPESADPDW